MNGFGYSPSRISPEVREIANQIPKIVSLYPSNLYTAPETIASICTLEDDLTHYKVDSKGLKINIKANAGGYIASFIMKNPLTLLPTATLGMWVWIEDASVISNLKLTFYTNSTYVAPITQYSIANSGITLSNGWNLLRFQVYNATYPLVEKTIYKIVVDGGSSNTEITSMTIGHIWAECPPKAQVVFIDDGCYPAFYTTAYPDLRARNLPVVWATSPNKMTTNPTLHMTESQLIAASIENNNEINFHSYGVGDTNTMTADELIDDCKNAILWLRARGYDGGKIRSAWLGNLAPQHTATQDMFFAYANPTGGAGAPCSFPFTNRWSLRRYAIHTSDPLVLPGIFEQMEATHSLMVMYTHDFNDAGGNNITTERWAQFLSLVDAGLVGGWLEFVTFNQLLERSGATTKPHDGDWVRELYEEYGSYGSLLLR